MKIENVGCLFMVFQAVLTSVDLKVFGNFISAWKKSNKSVDFKALLN